MSSISNITLLDNSNYKFKDSSIAFGTCSTGASTATKVVTIADTSFELRTGSVIGVKFTTGNTASSVKLNVNNSGAKSIYYNNSVYTGTSKNITGMENCIHYYMYDGTNWCFINYSGNYSTSDTYTSAYSTTAAGTAAKVATFTGYELMANQYFLLTMRYTNTAASAITLNVNSKGAKPVYINGEASSSSNYTFPAGTYLVYYDGTNYYVRTDGKLASDDNFEGTLSPIHGGTGKASLKDSSNALINALDTGSSTPVDNDYYISQYVSGGTTTTTYHRRPMSALWEYIKGKISSVLGLTDTSYGGSAAKVNNHTVEKDVPSNAVFTDTWQANSVNANGYVPYGSGHNSTVWATNASGSPSWRNSALYHNSRTTSANDKHSSNTDERVAAFLATSSMTTGKPPGDAHILHFNWDNGTATTGTWDAQIAITNSAPNIYSRSQYNGTWSSWAENFNTDNMELHVTAPITYDNATDTVRHYESLGSQKSVGDTSNQTPAWGGTFVVPSATADKWGHITALASHTVKIPNTWATDSAAGLISPGNMKRIGDLWATTTGTLTWNSSVAYTNYGSYVKRNGHTCHLYLNFTLSSYTLGTTIVTLPTNFRPDTQVDFNVVPNTISGDAPVLRITTGGAVSIPYCFNASTHKGIRALVTFTGAGITVAPNT